MTTIVISSPDMAKEALHKHDFAFLGRTFSHSLQTFDHHRLSVIFSDPSVHWKTLRRTCVSKILSSFQLDSTQNLRLRKLQEMLEYVNECCKKGDDALHIREVTFATCINSLFSKLFSIDVHGFSSDLSREFRDSIWGIMEEVGKPNVVDFLLFFE
ncbi:ferruginol synthase-like [Prosopis cineraria]|uniref:ferruginol synthase-like n=1 Tax=Prosopis cineraria TaxID=364024 RepID=UPI0024109D13|nr:ferruginol synthase-like [Prosopis cineraria]